MAQNKLFLLVSMVMVCLAPGIHGTFHLMFATSGQVNITEAGCGVTKVCVRQIEDCDPAVVGSCLFGSLELGASSPPNGSALDITLQGTAAANQYIAIGLQPSTGPTQVFVCGRNDTNMNNTFRFFTGDLNSDGTFNPTETLVKNILSNITGNLLQCQFTVRSVNATQTRSSDSTFGVQLGNGTIDGSGFGSFNVQRNRTSLNLADPRSTVIQTTTAAAATTVATTSSGSTSFISPASLLLWSVLAWPALLRM